MPLCLKKKLTIALKFGSSIVFMDFSSEKYLNLLSIIRNFASVDLYWQVSSITPSINTSSLDLKPKYWDIMSLSDWVTQYFKILLVLQAVLKFLFRSNSGWLFFRSILEMFTQNSAKLWFLLILIFLGANDCQRFQQASPKCV